MRNGYPRLLAMATAAGLLTTGCASNDLDSPLRPGNNSLQVRISVSSTADSAERDGMRLFVDKLVEYSDVPLDISLFYEEDPESSLLAGEADLILSDSAALIPYDSDFAIYSSPFYFRDYEHMTMTLNSPTFLQLTEQDCAENLQARQLGVLYGGTMMVISKESPIRAVKDMQEFTLAEPNDDYTAAAFGELFGQVMPAGDSPAETWQDDAVTAQEASAYTVAYVDSNRETAFHEGYAALQENGLRSARFVSENLRKSGKDLLTTETNFFAEIDKSRYDAVAMIIR